MNLINRWSGSLLSLFGVILAFVGFGLLHLDIESTGKFIIVVGFILTFSGLGWHFYIIRKQYSNSDNNKTNLNIKPWD